MRCFLLAGIEVFFDTPLTVLLSTVEEMRGFEFGVWGDEELPDFASVA